MTFSSAIICSNQLRLFIVGKGSLVTGERSGDELLIKVRDVRGFRFSSRGQHSHLF